MRLSPRMPCWGNGKALLLVLVTGFRVKDLGLNSQFPLFTYLSKLIKTHAADGQNRRTEGCYTAFTQLRCKGTAG